MSQKQAVLSYFRFILIVLAFTASIVVVMQGRIYIPGLVNSQKESIVKEVVRNEKLVKLHVLGQSETSFSWFVPYSIHRQAPKN